MCYPGYFTTFTRSLFQTHLPLNNAVFMNSMLATNSDMFRLLNSRPPPGYPFPPQNSQANNGGGASSYEQTHHPDPRAGARLNTQLSSMSGGFGFFTASADSQQTNTPIRHHHFIPQQNSGGGFGGFQNQQNSQAVLEPRTEIEEEEKDLSQKSVQLGQENENPEVKMGT